MCGISSAATIIALDLETTGLSAIRDSIVELAAVRWRQGREDGHFQALVNPGRLIPPAATRIHGITNSMVRECPPLAEVLPAFLAFCADADTLVAHNAPFDLGFLRGECARLQLPALTVPAVDTCALARTRFPGWPSYRLESLKAMFGLGHSQAHRALEDARDCLAVYLHCQTPQFVPPPAAAVCCPPLPDELAPLREAMTDGHTVTIEYRDVRGRITQREVRPIIVNGDGTVLEAFCLLRNETRRFQLHRIQRLWRTP